MAMAPGAVGIMVMIALAGPRVIALLAALVGFLVSSRGMGTSQRASLSRAFLRTLRDIAVTVPSPSRGHTRCRIALRHKQSAPMDEDHEC
jgi:hypothetical protein